MLKLENITKIYEGKNFKQIALNNVTLAFRNNEFVSILGPSGSGKTTLLNIIGGIDKASSGTVRAGKWILNELSEAQLSEYRSKYLGLVFQFHYLLKDFTALENVAMPALIAGMPKKEAYERAGQLLQDVGVYERKDHLQSQLSGGERQRVAVARSLINNPQLLLADEPTGNLDPANAEKIGQLLFSIVDKYSKTFILVTHDMNLASKGDFQYRIVEGKFQ